ncbi:MAG: phosphatidate cytidylyltransferase [Burkholderiaceae bacterium]
MLATRLLTVFVAAAFLIPFSLYANAWGFSVLAAVICGLVLWEWLSLTSIGPAMRWLLLSVWVGLVVGALLDPWLIQTPWALGLVGWVGLVWLLYVPYALGRVRTPNGPTAAITSAWLMLGTWAAVWLSREQSLAFMVSIFALVWLADTAAYFGGRALGRRKLAPRISPGKTWEGVITAVLANLVYLWLAAQFWSDSYPQVLVEGFGPMGAALMVVLLTAVSVMGDLHQSLLKRQAGVKDSGHLLPGHGGFFDRFDALIAVTPVALALLLAADRLR